MSRLPRSVRRIATKNAAALADEYSRCCYATIATGARVQVTDPIAVKALHRAFLIMLKGKCEPHAVRITQDTARAFPGMQIKLPDATPYLAVGLDASGRGTYALRHITTPLAPDKMTVELCNRRAALDQLRPLLETGANPAPHTKEVEIHWHQ